MSIYLNLMLLVPYVTFKRVFKLRNDQFWIICVNICTKCVLYTEGASPASEDEGVEGTLVRKHEWESAAKRASNRWDV